MLNYIEEEFFLF